MAVIAINFRKLKYEQLVTLTHPHIHTSTQKHERGRARSHQHCQVCNRFKGCNKSYSVTHFSSAANNINCHFADTQSNYRKQMAQMCNTFPSLSSRIALAFRWCHIYYRRRHFQRRRSISTSSSLNRNHQPKTKTNLIWNSVFSLIPN